MFATSQGMAWWMMTDDRRKGQLLTGIKRDGGATPLVYEGHLLIIFLAWESLRVVAGSVVALRSG